MLYFPCPFAQWVAPREWNRFFLAFLFVDIVPDHRLVASWYRWQWYRVIFVWQCWMHLLRCWLYILFGSAPSRPLWESWTVQYYLLLLVLNSCVCRNSLPLGMVFVLVFLCRKNGAHRWVIYWRTVQKDFFYLLFRAIRSRKWPLFSHYYRLRSFLLAVPPVLSHRIARCRFLLLSLFPDRSVQKAVLCLLRPVRYLHRWRKYVCFPFLFALLMSRNFLPEWILMHLLIDWILSFHICWYQMSIL